MPNVEQHRNNTTAVRLSYTPFPGEFFFDTDTSLLYVGDGATAGGLLVGGGGTGSTVLVANKTADFPLAGADSGFRFTNAGASVTIVGLLPPATVGLVYGFSVAVAHTLGAVADGTDTINWAGTASAAGGTIEGNVVGWFALLECHVAGRWTVTQAQGGWIVT